MKVNELHETIRKLKHCTDKEWLVNDINKVNSMIRGVIQYYQTGNAVNYAMGRHWDMLKYAAYKALKKHGGKWTPANQVHNLRSVHEERAEQIPAIWYQDMLIGVTSLSFAKWVKIPLMNQKETPYTPEGRELHAQRTGKIPLKVRADDLLFSDISELIAKGVKRPIYNFEYYMNRPYAYNRDKGKCAVCGDPVDKSVHIHHISPKLPLAKVNKVPNLKTVCYKCHVRIHDHKDYQGEIPDKIWKKIFKLREKLLLTN